MDEPVRRNQEKYLYAPGWNANVSDILMKHALRQLAKNPGFTVTALLL